MEGSGMAAVLDGIGDFGDGGDGDGDGGEGAEEPSVVYYCLEESTGYMQPALRALAVAHTIVAFLCIIGYNCLKVSPAPQPPHNPPQPPEAPRAALIPSRRSYATPPFLATPPFSATPLDHPWPRPLLCPPRALALLFGHASRDHAPSPWPRPLLAPLGSLTPMIASTAPTFPLTPNPRGPRDPDVTSP